MSTHKIRLWRNKKNISIFQLKKKSALSRVMLCILLPCLWEQHNLPESSNFRVFILLYITI